MILKKKKIGITGQTGFLGTHLFNTLGLYPDEFERILFKDIYFEDHNKLSSFIEDCDVIVHLAAMNRHNDPEVIYNTNINLVKKLISALDTAGNKPHVLISSSIQEKQDNPYGRSKKEGREILAEWSKANNTKFTGLIFPNLFGPFGNPFYNSFIATFSHLLNKNEKPKVEADNTIPLLYVGKAVDYIIDAIRTEKNSRDYEIQYEEEVKVTNVLKKLEEFKQLYSEEGIIPSLETKFDRDLFNTFRSYINYKNVFPSKLKSNGDERGTFVETIKSNIGGQFSFSTTKPGITRGNHFHTRKIERFIVIKGNARIQLRRIGTNELLEFELNGNEPSFVDMPVWYTHNITNTGDEDLYTLFWINEFYNPEDPDTYFENV